MSQFCPHFGKGRHENSPSRGLFDQPPGEMSSIRDKLPDHAGDHVVLSPEGVVLVTSPGMGSSHPRPPQSLEHSGLLALCQRTLGSERNRYAIA